MKRNYLCFLLLSLHLAIFPHTINNKEEDDAKQQRRYYFGWIDHQFEGENYTSEPLVLNGKYVHSILGIDIRGIARRKGQNKQDFISASGDSLFTFYGKLYRNYWNIEDDAYNPRLITLKDIEDKYATIGKKAPSLFLINDVLLTNDLALFRIDEDYIDTVEFVARRDFHSIKPDRHLDLKTFHIYTKGSPTYRKPRVFAVTGKDSLRLNPCQYEEANHPAREVYLNGIRTRSSIGLDLDSLLRMPKGEYSVDYDSSHVYISSRQYKPRLLSLRELVEKHLPDPEQAARALVMVGSTFVTSDYDEILVDPDYIHSVRLFRAEEIEKLYEGRHHNFTIIRFYVKDQNTLDMSRELLIGGYGRDPLVKNNVVYGDEMENIYDYPYLQEGLKK